MPFSISLKFCPVLVGTFLLGVPAGAVPPGPAATVERTARPGAEELARANTAPAQLPPAVERELQALLRHPALRQAHVGVAVMALGRVTGASQFPSRPYDAAARPLLFSSDASKRFLPASNMKLLTAAWVLHRLGPERTFETQLLMGATAPDENGVRSPALVLRGDGDPSLAPADLAGMLPELQGPATTATAVLVDGSVLGAEQFGGRYPDGWTLDDSLWDYGAPVTGLVLNRNSVRLTVTGTAPGEKATLSLEPGDLPLENRVTTVGPAEPTWPVTIDRDIAPGTGYARIVVSGRVHPGQVDHEDLAVADVEPWARGIFAGLRPGRLSETDAAPAGALPEPGKVLARHTSPPLKTLLAQFLKPSDNLYGEVLLRRAAAELPASGEELDAHSGPGGTYIASTGLAGRAHSDMARWLADNKIDTAGLRFSDGSGLSRYNMLTPLAVAQVLALAEKLPGGEAFFAALPVAGVDGTLKKRYKGTAAEGNVRAKTGTFSIVNCLSGYVTTQDGHRLAVSLLTDFVPSGETARQWQGRVFATLARASWVGAGVTPAGGQR